MPRSGPPPGRRSQHEDGLRAGSDLRQTAVADDGLDGADDRREASSVRPDDAELERAVLPALEIREKGSVADLGKGLPGAHPEIGGDDERQIAEILEVDLGKWAGRFAQCLHPHEHLVALGSAERWQAGHIPDPFVIESAQLVPVPRLGAQAHLPKRVPPPLLEALAPALVAAEPVRATACRKRGRDRQLDEGTARPTPYDEVHHERVVVGFHPGSVRNVGLPQEKSLTERVLRVEMEG